MPEEKDGSRGSAGGNEQGGMEQLVAARRAKLERLRAEGREPYPARCPQRTHLALEAIAAFEAEEAVAGEGPRGVRLNGRLVGAVRRMGGSAFAHLADPSGRVQLHLRRDVVGADAFASFVANVDAGDIVSVKGWMFRTRRGEVSLAVEELAVLAKSLFPLPDKWHGLRDVETRFRQRHLDLLSNESSRRRFLARSRIVSATRRFLEDRGFLEVETPILQPIYGGGAAAPFTTHYAALERDMYLRIADELYLKRLLVGGLEKVFEIGKDFRNEGIDRTHLPEFTQMECYWAFADYTDMMALTEDLIASVAQEVLGSTEIVFQGSAVDLAPPWRRLSVRDAVADAAGIDLEETRSLEALQGAAARAGVSLDDQPTWAKAVDKLLQRLVEPELVAPTFLMDYPVALSPLAKRKPSAPDYVERFEPFVGGMEIGNAFTELNDPVDQRNRFEALAVEGAKGDIEAHPLDEEFLEALMHGMPPAGGLGLGMDRLVMLLTGEANIREVVLFPQLRSRDR